MQEAVVVVLVIFASFGYVALHGHRFGKDCWLCQYRGLAVITGPISLGGYCAYDG